MVPKSCNSWSYLPCVKGTFIKLLPKCNFHTNISIIGWGQPRCECNAPSSTFHNKIKQQRKKNINFWTIHRSIIWNKFIHFCLLDGVFQILFYQFAWVIKGKAYSSYPQVSFLRSVKWYLGPTQLQHRYYISGREWDWQCSGTLDRFQSKKRIIHQKSSISLLRSSMYEWIIRNSVTR